GVREAVDDHLLTRREGVARSDGHRAVDPAGRGDVDAVETDRRDVSGADRLRGAGDGEVVELERAQPDPAPRQALRVHQEAALAVGAAIGHDDRVAVRANGDLVAAWEVAETVSGGGPVRVRTRAKDADRLAGALAQTGADVEGTINRRHA